MQDIAGYCRILQDIAGYERTNGLKMELEKFLDQPESKTLEFKRDLSSFLP